MKFGQMGISIQEHLFNTIHTSTLLYNTCWEDPRCDRRLMGFDSDSEIVMITSAGCNALEYLLDEPAAIHCVDLNYRQNAVLELKKAAFKHGDYSLLFDFFGNGALDKPKRKYKHHLRGHLSEKTAEFWDQQIKAFSNKGIRKSYYHFGASGTFAWLTMQFLRSQKDVYQALLRIFEAKNLEEQAFYYDKIEGKVMNRLTKWLLTRHFTMCLVGVPKSQQALLKGQFEEGAFGYIKECLRKVFTQIPAGDNYFYKVYLTGKYDENCCPEYLKNDNFDCISRQLDQIHTHTCSIADFLKANPKAYSHFVLLDHQDWLAAHQPEALAEEWRLILANARKGTKILLRSAASKVDFFPQFVLEAVHFEPFLTHLTHQEDRVSTYASVYLAIVK